MLLFTVAQLFTPLLFIWAIDLLIRFVHISETRWSYPHSVGSNPGDFGVGFFGVAPALFALVRCFLCWRNANLPGDSRVGAVVWFLFVFFLHGFASFFEAKVFHTSLFYGSLTVRTEP